MKDQVKTYPELKELISSGEKVTMNGKLMNHARLGEIPLHEIKLFLSQGYFEHEPKAIEGEFIGKDDPRQAEVQPGIYAEQQAAILQRQAIAQSDIFSSSLSGLGASVLGGMFR